MPSIEKRDDAEISQALPHEGEAGQDPLDTTFSTPANLRLKELLINILDGVSSQAFRCKTLLEDTMHHFGEGRTAITRVTRYLGKLDGKDLYVEHITYGSGFNSDSGALGDIRVSLGDQSVATHLGGPGAGEINALLNELIEMLSRFREERGRNRYSPRWIGGEHFFP